MKKQLSILILLFASFSLFGQDGDWQLIKDKITTEWSEEVDPVNVLPEYPRPQMKRDNWQNLNGLWEYAIVSKNESKPTNFQGKILVPFAVESALSGVGKTPTKEDNLWYKTSFTVSKSMKRKNVILHFGAVDWETEIFVNGKKVGSHKGGFDPFSFDITTYITKSGSQELTVKVWDPTSDGPQPRGKQVNRPEGIWYTSVSGIWQTVWLEGVAPTYIKDIKNTPNISNNTITVATDIANAQAGDNVKVTVLNGETELSAKTVEAGKEVVITVTNPELWTPDNPHLYNLKIELLRKDKSLDAVESYFAMRSITKKKDNEGVYRMMLNDEFVFQYGPLDQGWWPDGLYTAPTDEALKFDIVKTKEMGFNMIRKHVKVEPARWYYYCDMLGMLVWQDMPSGDQGSRWNNRPGITGAGYDMDRSAASEEIYRTEWESIMDALYNFPSIVVWVPFNEAWGQFKTKEIVEWTAKLDPTRLVNEASGGNFHYSGDIIDLHNYPDPAMPDAKIFGGKQVVVLGEFGGLGLPLEGHIWQEKDNWGYRTFKTKDELKNRYAKLMEELAKLVPMGLSAAVYTQTTDVEGEVNGLMSYDRKVIKMPENFLKDLHKQLYKHRIDF
ncbi:glycoside hydrolase family 2 protein [Chondrinema litorale]|uniref:glycoside hydrolase family 2 protein n=1 Tax=Chondrinema litorale TaxID=2994555 RepID=UPI002543D80B|nr:sugar-binding domain-containing protein [Chondrinema litorale]UZR97823.1 beta-galactosidase [Chondrinema litorale]